MMEDMAEEKRARVDRERLPRDTIPLILIYLPVKDLVRFKLVAKWWYILLSSPNFILKHQSHLAAIKQQSVDQGITLPSLMLTVSDTGTDSVQPLLLSFDTANITVSTTQDVYEPVVVPATSWNVIIGPSVGVFCLISRAGDVTLWNPATAEVRTVFRFNADQSLEDYERFGKEGHGFICICNEEVAADFRFVKFYSPDETTQDFEFDTYSLSTNVWTTRMISNFFLYYIDPSSVELNGTIHWYTLGNNDVHWNEPDTCFTYPYILTCDLSSPSPTVKTIDLLPDLHMEPTIDNILLTKFDNQYLSFIIHPESSEYIDVWVMGKYGLVESWVRQLRIRPMSTMAPIILSGHWNNLGTFFIYYNDEENMKWVINNSEHNISLDIKGDVKFFDYMESVMPIDGIRGRMPLTHVIQRF